MKNSDNRFHHESLQDCDSITELLSALQKGLKNGRLTFSDNDGEITLNPDGLLNVDLQAADSSELASVELRISWHKRKKQNSGKKLKVS